MTPAQMIQYLGGQIQTLGDDLAVANRTEDKEKVRVKFAAIKPQVEFLRGYATCLEHGGHLPKAVIDDLFRVFDLGNNV